MFIISQCRPSQHTRHRAGTGPRECRRRRDARVRRQLVVRVVHQVRRPGHHPRIRRLRPVSTVRRRREDPESIAVVSLFSSPYVRATRLTPCLFNSCANHDESGGAHAGQDPHGHGHGHGTNDSSSTVFGALGPPGSTLPGFTGIVPSSLEQLFDTLELVDHAGEKLDPAVHFKGKVIGVYFSSGTCPGCVRFSPTPQRVHRDQRAGLRHGARAGRQRRGFRAGVRESVPGIRVSPVQQVRVYSNYRMGRMGNSTNTVFWSQHSPQLTLERVQGDGYSPTVRVPLRRQGARHRVGPQRGDVQPGHVRRGVAHGTVRVSFNHRAVRALRLTRRFMFCLQARVLMDGLDRRAQIVAVSGDDAHAQGAVARGWDVE